MWFVLALAAGLLFAINRLIIRTVAKNTSNTLGLTVIHDLLAGLMLLPFALIDLQLPSSGRTWLLVVLVAVLILMADWFSTMSLAKIEASLFQIVGQLRHIIVLIGAVILFSESLTFVKVLAIFILIAGVVVTMLEKAKIKLSRGVWDAFWSTVFIALASLVIKEVSDDISAAFLAAFALVGAGLLGTVLLNFKVGILQDVFSQTRNKLLIATAIFALFEFLFFKALELGEASRVTPVTQSSMVFTIIGGYLFLNERSNLIKKTIGSSLIILAIIMIYLV